MKLTIITINYNNVLGLEKTIKSVIEQSKTDFEYIVIDGGSTDGSADIIKKYAENIDYWVSEPDRGVYHAMNKGILKAKGDYILFINSGDTLYEKDTLRKIFSYPFTTDLIYGDLARIYPDGTTDFVAMLDKIDTKFLIYASLTHPTTLIKRSLFEKHGLYREDLEIVSDWAFFLKLVAFTNVTRKHIPITVTLFSMDGLSTMNEDKVLAEREKVISESFSFEVIEMFKLYETYKLFYEKKIFQTIRKYLAIYRNISRRAYWRELIHRRRFGYLIYLFNKVVRRQNKDVSSIPIIIINYNRLADLKKLVDFLLTRNHKNIIIVDNHSSYPPLLEYYKKIQDQVKVEIMDKNYGHLVFWRNERLQNLYGEGYYVITDSDIIPNENMPIDYLSQMKKILDKHKEWTKLGLALQIDNLPDYLRIKDKVINWESKFWEDEIQPNLFRAQVDTTFALYPPRYRYDVGNFLNGARIAGNFTAKHGGWYIDVDNMTDEERFYYETANASNSWKLNKEGDHIGSNEY